MKGTVTNYAMNIKTVHPNTVIIRPDGSANKSDASKLLGKKVVVSHGKAKINGKVVSTHGNNGSVCARFTKGVPGQVVGTECDIE